MEGAANKPKAIQRTEVSDYTFAFNENRFSDKTLQILISMDPQEIRYDRAICLHEDDTNGALGKNAENATELAEESSSNATAMRDGNETVKVRYLHVNSAILAESSQFFKKLFSSGMRGTEQRHATIHITPSEERAFIYLLKFIYGGTIETQSANEFLDVQILADKFEVPSCINGCSKALCSVPMTMVLASLILCLPSSLLTTDVMRPIVKDAEGFLLTHFSSEKFTEEYMNLRLHIIEDLLKSDKLHVSSEDYVYDFAINWANRHYHDQDERKKVFQNKLIKLIRFPQMSDYKLSQIIISNEEMQSANALKLVSEALCFKAGSSFEIYNSEEKKFCKRFYKLGRTRVIEIHSSKTLNIVFCEFNLGEEQDQVSETFYMWGRSFSLTLCHDRRFYLSCERNVELEKREPPVEYGVLLRPKGSGDFPVVFNGRRGPFHVNQRSCAFHLGDTETGNYNINNVLYMQAVFAAIPK